MFKTPDYVTFPCLVGLRPDFCFAWQLYSMFSCFSVSLLAKFWSKWIILWQKLFQKLDKGILFLKCFMEWMEMFLHNRLSRVATKVFHNLFLLGKYCWNYGTQLELDRELCFFPPQNIRLTSLNLGKCKKVYHLRWELFLTWFFFCQWLS